MSRPVLLNSCARATTAAEARFRIDYPLAASRDTRVIAFDVGSDEVVRAASTEQWSHARFYTLTSVPEEDPVGGLHLTTVDGRIVPLVAELEGVDALLMVASSAVGAEAVATIGAACAARGIMTAGLVLTEGLVSGDTLAALRPYARMLLAPADEEDLVELLRAIRA